MDFYIILEQIMNEKGLSIPDVARTCGLSDSTIRSILTRKAKRVDLYVAFKLHKGLNVSLERLNGVPEDKQLKNQSLEQITAIFSQLSSDNQAKLTELALLYLDAQRKSEERK